MVSWGSPLEPIAVLHGRWSPVVGATRGVCAVLLRSRPSRSTDCGKWDKLEDYRRCALLLQMLQPY